MEEAGLKVLEALLEFTHSFTKVKEGRIGLGPRRHIKVCGVSLERVILGPNKGGPNINYSVDGIYYG